MGLSEVLLAVEKAAPVDAVQAVTRSVAAGLNAVWVSFLVADMSGRALARLVHAPIGEGAEGRRQDEDVAVVLPFDGARRSRPCVRSRRRSRTPAAGTSCGRR